ncbi:MAG: XRE family transcriptional regulator [Luteibacter sp.]
MKSIAINPEMLALAREYRNVTQQDLSAAVGISQAKLAKIEGGMSIELTEGQLDSVSKHLNFPKAFFGQAGQRLGFGSSALYYRRRQDVTAVDRKRIAGIVNIVRFGLAKLLASVEIQASKRLPQVELEEFGGDAAAVARHVRALWQLPDGPVASITAFIEAAGVVVIPCRFDCRAMDGTSLRLADMPPLIFINDALSGDRWRFTLAHELAHLVLHDTPRETMEDEADAFASEFLMPDADIGPQLRSLGSIRLDHLTDMKPYWKVSIASMLMKASSLGLMTGGQKQYLWRQLSAMGYRKEEPLPLPRENPATFPGLVQYFEEDLQFTARDLGELLHLEQSDLRDVFGVKTDRQSRHLRAV